jgi:adenosylcobinamide-GDP ribazoletransferase
LKNTGYCAQLRYLVNAHNDIIAMANGFHPLDPFRQLIMSLTFLTQLPIPFSRTAGRMRLTDGMSVFPLAGALIGAAVGGLLHLFHWIGVPNHIAAALAVIVGLLMTGALHEDGLADVTDGFGGGKDRKERLDIMRDSRIGSYGTLALITIIGLKLLCYAELVRLPLVNVLILTATAGAFSRALMVDLMFSTRHARDDGLSHMAGRPDRPTALVALLSAIGIAVVAGFMFRPDAALFAVAAAVGVAASLRYFAIRMIDGQTGDVCGAVQVLAEVAMLAVFASMVR